MEPNVFEIEENEYAQNEGLSSSSQKKILFTYFIGWLLVIPIIVSIIFNLSGYDDDSVFMFIVYLLGVIPCVKIAWPLFVNERNVSLSKLIRTILIGMGLLLAMNVIVGNLIELLFSLETSSNQESLNEMKDQNVIFYVGSIVLLAPILEEVVFRGVIFNWARKNYNFLVSAAISGFLFGFIHVVGSLFDGNYIDLIYIFLYGFMGMIFSKAYEDTGSIYGCIALHAVYNAFSVLVMFLV